MTEDLLTTFNISLVVRGTVSETRADAGGEEEPRYAIPAAKGVFRRAHMHHFVPSHAIHRKILPLSVVFFILHSCSEWFLSIYFCMFTACIVTCSLAHRVHL